MPFTAASTRRLPSLRVHAASALFNALANHRIAWAALLQSIEKQACRAHIIKMHKDSTLALAVSRPTAVDTVQQPRFHCDEMLAHLARFLRAAGFDTRLASDGAPDRQILREAADEGRWLLTLDRNIMEHKLARDVAILLQQGTLDEHAEFLATRWNLDWLGQAFSRCLLDNAPLEEANAAHYARVPAESRPVAQVVKHCPECGRIYWRGSHFQRMRRRLAGWQERHCPSEHANDDVAL
jgi:uncharacterized protein with PIN domain